MKISCYISSVKNTSYQKEKAIQILRQFYPGQEIKVSFFASPENDLAMPCVTIHQEEKFTFPKETPYYRPHRPAEEVVSEIFRLLGIF